MVCSATLYLSLLILLTETAIGKEQARVSPNQKRLEHFLKQRDGLKDHLGKLRRKCLTTGARISEQAAICTAKQTETAENVDPVVQKLDLNSGETGVGTLSSRNPGNNGTSSEICNIQLEFANAHSSQNRIMHNAGPSFEVGSTQLEFAETQYDSALQLERQSTAVRLCTSFPDETEIGTPITQMKKNPVSVTCTKPLPMSAHNSSKTWKSPYIRDHEKSKAKLKGPNQMAYIQMCELLDTFTVKQLDAELTKNGQSKTGGKDVKIHKVADGRVHGKLPECPLCRSTKLRSRYCLPKSGSGEIGQYWVECPGYFDQKLLCKIACPFMEKSPSNIVRESWMTC
jgi:hypothetical protein